MAVRAGVDAGVQDGEVGLVKIPANAGKQILRIWRIDQHLYAFTGQRGACPHGHALDTFQVLPTQLEMEARTLSSLIEARLPPALAAATPLPEPVRRQPSRRARSFPIPPHVSLEPDEKAQRWLLHISATDRAGLLYSIARVLARHGLSVQLAKVMTLGERVEDSFLLEGPQLQHTTRQLDLEKELTHILSVETTTKPHAHSTTAGR